MNYKTTSPPGYEQLTHAYNMHTSERYECEDELNRLRKAGRGAEIIVWDTRGTGKRTRLSGDRVTKMESVWGAIWAEPFKKEDV